MVFHDEHGTPVRASEVVRSMDADGVLAGAFVRAATRSAVLSLARATRVVDEDETRRTMREEMQGFDWEDVFEVAVTERMKRLAVERKDVSRP